MTSTDLLAYGSGLTHEVDWADNGNYAHAASNVTDVAQQFRYGEGTNRRSNPQRPTADHGSGSVTLLGDDYVPGRSAVLTEAQLNGRHRYRVRRGSTVLASFWIQEGRHQGGGQAGQETAFVLEGLLERTARADTTLTQPMASTASTSAAVLQLLKDAYGLADSEFSQNLASTPLADYGFEGAVGQYASLFGLVSGGLPTARRAGRFGLFDPTRTAASPVAVSSDNYVVLEATTEFDQEQLWNKALIQYDGPETPGSGTGTGSVTDPGAGGASGVVTDLTIANPASGVKIEDMAATLTVGAATGTWREIEGDPGSGNASGTVTDPGQSDLRGVDTNLTLNDPATGHVIEDMAATLTVGAATGTWREIEGDPGSGNASGTVTDPGAFGASGVRTDLTIANPDANHRIEDMDATFTVGAASGATYTLDDRDRTATLNATFSAFANNFEVTANVTLPAGEHDRILDDITASAVATNATGVPVSGVTGLVLAGSTARVTLEFAATDGTATIGGVVYPYWSSTRVDISSQQRTFVALRRSDSNLVRVRWLGNMWSSQVSGVGTGVTINVNYTLSDRRVHTLPNPTNRTAPSWEVERVGRSQNPNNRNNSFARVTLVGTDAPGTWRLNDGGTNVDVSSWEHSTGGKTYRLGGIAVSFAITWKLRDTRTHTVTPSRLQAPSWDVDRVSRSTDPTDRNRKFVRVTVANAHEPGRWRINDGTNSVDLSGWSHTANRREYRITGIAVSFAVTWRTRDTRTHTVTPTRRTAPNWDVDRVGLTDNPANANNRLVRVTVLGTNAPGTWRINDGTHTVDLTTWTREANRREYKLLTIAVSFAVTWTLDDENVYTLEAQNGDSIRAWEERVLMFPVWFTRTATAALQARIDALAEPRNIHTIDLSLNQPTTQRNANVDALQGGDFIALDIRDDRTKTRIRGNAFVMHSEIVDNRNEVPYKRLICLEAPGTPATDSAPSKPAAPTLTVLSHSSIRATWAYPSSDGGVAVSSWTVRYRENGSSGAWATVTISDGDDRNVEISGLSQSTEYEVQVRATNPIGNSPWSDSATATTTGAPARPSRPAAPTVTALSRQAIRATWTAPSANNSPITSYDVRYRTGSDAWTLVEDLTSTTTDISGLTASTSYSVQVRATNGIGNSDWSPSGTASTSAPDLPAAPDEPTIAVTHNSFTATWVAPDAGGGTIASYNLRYRTGGAAWATLTGITTLTRTVSSLTVGATYDVQVAARNETGLGPYSDSAIAALHGVPDQPDPPRLQSAPIPAAGTNTRQITMQWTAPASDLAITSYSLRYRLSSTLHDWTTINSITATERQISALAANTTYEFQVRATSAAGNSPWSEDGNGTTATFVAPAAPARPTASAQSRTEIAASWVAPTNNGGQAPTSYDLRYRTGSGTWTPITGVTSPHTITGLVQATAYQVQVRAINSGGTSAWSPSATATTNAPGAPGAPTSLAVAAVVPTGGANTRSLTATWGAPSDNGGFAITHYDLRYKLASGNSWTQENSVSSGAAISNLPVNTQYDVQVRAANEQGDGPWTTSVRRRTHGVIAPAAMAAPTITAVNPAHGAITRSLSAAFVEPTLHGGQNPTRYTVRYQAADADFWTTIPNAGTTSPYVQAGLAIGQAYDFQIAAVNSGGTGPWSPSGRGTTVGIHTPAAPAAPTLTVRDHDDILVEWTAPSATGGAAVTDYTLQWRIVASPANAWTTVASTGGTDTAYNLLSLTRVTEYEVRVAAINSAGTGPWSDSATATTEASEPGSPGILNIVQVTPAAGDETRGLTVTWLAPNDDGGSALTGYKVRYKLTTDSDYTTIDAGLDTSETISGLAVATAYDISVRAENAIGAGAWSPDSTATTASAVVPAAPSPRASAVEGTDDLVTEWSEPDDGGAPITRYRIRWTAAGSDSSTDGQLNNVQSPHTRTGLLPATEYSIQVGARNSVGWSEWSAVTRATTGDVADVWLREDGDDWLREDGGAWLLESNT